MLRVLESMSRCLWRESFLDHGRKRKKYTPTQELVRSLRSGRATALRIPSSKVVSAKFVIKFLSKFTTHEAVTWKQIAHNTVYQSQLLLQLQTGGTSESKLSHADITLKILLPHHRLGADHQCPWRQHSVRRITDWNNTHYYFSNHTTRIRSFTTTLTKV